LYSLRHLCRFVKKTEILTCMTFSKPVEVFPQCPAVTSCSDLKGGKIPFGNIERIYGNLSTRKFGGDIGGSCFIHNDRTDYLGRNNIKRKITSILGRTRNHHTIQHGLVIAVRHSS